MGKIECKWVASRWKLPDILTKMGLAQLMYDRMEKHNTRLHELSLNQKKEKAPNTNKSKKTHHVNYMGHINRRRHVNPINIIDIIDDHHYNLSGSREADREQSIFYAAMQENNDDRDSQCHDDD